MMADRRGSEGSLFSGNRLVRKDGVIKFEHIRFKSSNLIEYVGKTLTVISTGSSWKIDHITVYHHNKIVAIIQNNETLISSYETRT